MAAAEPELRIAGRTLVGDRQPDGGVARQAAEGIGDSGERRLFLHAWVQAQYGRVFEPRDAAGGCAVVVSYAYWRDQLGADKTAPGRALTLDQRACLVVGVMPERFSFYPRETSLWTVITPDSDFVRQPWKTPAGVFGRLRPGVSRAAAEQELAAIEASIAAERL